MFSDYLIYELLVFGCSGIISYAFISFTHALAHMIIKLDSYDV